MIAVKRPRSSPTLTSSRATTVASPAPYVLLTCSARVASRAPVSVPEPVGADGAVEVELIVVLLVGPPSGRRAHFEDTPPGHCRTIGLGAGRWALAARRRRSRGRLATPRGFGPRPPAGAVGRADCWHDPALPVAPTDPARAVGGRPGRDRADRLRAARLRRGGAGRRHPDRAHLGPQPGPVDPGDGDRGGG